jgi:hypothetical protein
MPIDRMLENASFVPAEVEAMAQALRQSATSN